MQARSSESLPSRPEPTVAVRRQNRDRSRAAQSLLQATGRSHPRPRCRALLRLHLRRDAADDDVTVGDDAGHPPAVGHDHVADVAFAHRARGIDEAVADLDRARVAGHDLLDCAGHLVAPPRFAGSIVPCRSPVRGRRRVEASLPGWRVGEIVPDRRALAWPNVAVVPEP